MARSLRLLAAASVFALAALAASGAARAGECRPSDSGTVEVVQRMYQAASLNDLDDVAAALTPDFYMFDSGQRHTGAELVARVKQLNAAGKNFLFDLVEPEAHLACDTVWITYENRASLSDTSGVHQASFLESAVLVWTDNGGWKLRFLQSTLVPPAQ